MTSRRYMFAGILFGLCMSSKAVETAAQVKARLLSAYGSTETRPKLKNANAGEDVGPEVVDIQVYVDQYQALDMIDQSFGIDGFLRLWWKDPELNFTNPYFDKLNLGPSERAKIWKPSLYWEGAKKITLPKADGTGDFGELVYVYADGTVWWSRQARFVLKCPVSRNLYLVPFDSQVCEFLTGPYSEDASMIYLQWRPNEIALANWDGACLSDYAITNVSQQSILQDYVTSQWTFASATLTFTRVPFITMTSYFIPGCLMVFISYLGFYIDSAATPARVALGMLCMVVVMTNMVALSHTLPPSPRPSWIIRFITYSFYFNAAAMTEQIIVSFGNAIYKWRDAQFKLLCQHQTWREALYFYMAKHTEGFFREWDVDGDGGLNRQEFRDGVHACFDESLAPITEVNDIFNLIDNDGSGLISIEEMVAAIKAGALFKEAPPKTVGISSVNAKALDPNDLIDPDEECIDVDVGEEIRTADDTARQRTTAPVEGVRPNVHFYGRAASFKQSIQTRIRPTAKQLGPASFKLSNFYRDHAAGELNKGAVWVFSTFHLFPVIARARYLDQVFRVVFPVAYVTFLLIHFSEVNYGYDQQALLESAPCYRALF